MQSLFISIFVSSFRCFKKKKKALVSLKAHYILQNLFISEALIAFHISEKRHEGVVSKKLWHYSFKTYITFKIRYSKRDISDGLHCNYSDFKIRLLFKTMP